MVGLTPRATGEGGQRPWSAAGAGRTRAARGGSFLSPLEMRPSSIAPSPAESQEAPPTPQHPSPIRGTTGSRPGLCAIAPGRRAGAPPLWARHPVELAGPLGTPLGLAQRKRASPRGVRESVIPSRKHILFPGWLPKGARPWTLIQREPAQPEPSWEMQIPQGHAPGSPRSRPVVCK